MKKYEYTTVVSDDDKFDEACNELSRKGWEECSEMKIVKTYVGGEFRAAKQFRRPLEKKTAWKNSDVLPENIGSSSNYVLGRPQKDSTFIFVCYYSYELDLWIEQEGKDIIPKKFEWTEIPK
jgi:hypothetical protein